MLSLKAHFVGPEDQTNCEWIYSGVQCRLFLCPGSTVSAGPVAALQGPTLLTATHPSYQSAAGGSWVTGQIIDVKVAGDVFPGASGTVTPPPPVQLTSPSCSNRNCGTVRPSTSFTWTGGSGGTVRLTLEAVGRPERLICDFPATQGSARFPLGLLRHLQSNLSAPLRLEVAAVDQKTIGTQPAEIDLTAGTVSLAGDVTVQVP